MTEEKLQEEITKIGKFLGENYADNPMKTLLGRCVLNAYEKEYYKTWYRDNEKSRENFIELVGLSEDGSVVYVVCDKDLYIQEKEYPNSDNFISDVSVWKFYGKEI